jgi:hypothetical protein
MFSIKDMNAFDKEEDKVIIFCKNRERNDMHTKKISTKYQHNDTKITPYATPQRHHPCPAPPFPWQTTTFAAGKCLTLNKRKEKKNDKRRTEKNS